MKIDPYRIIFPVGIFLSFFGIGAWLPFGFKWLNAYPVNYHASIMIGGFLFLFALGFLMTAIPRFTGTETASFFELLGVSILNLALAFCCIFYFQSAFQFILFLQMIFLVVFGCRRFMKRAYNPPTSFLFLALGILAGLFSVGVRCLETSFEIPSPLKLLAHNILFQGMMLCFVLGVGSRLIPALLGWSQLPQVKGPNKQEKRDYDFIILSVLVFLLAISFIVEVFVDLQLGRVLRALITTITIIKFWKVISPPKVKTWVSKWLWASSWSLIIGLWGYALFPAYGVHLLHIFFIGGLSLMTLMIATRVTLAHGDHNMDLEVSSDALKWTGILILVAMLTRVVAPFMPKTYLSHLAYASMTWLAAMITWCYVFIKKIIPSVKESQLVENTRK